MKENKKIPPATVKRLPLYLQCLEQIDNQTIGISSKKFNDISQNIPLMQEIVTKMEKESKNFDINSTPTFIVNDKYKISGALSFKDFEKELLKSINAKKS